MRGRCLVGVSENRRPRCGTGKNVYSCFACPFAAGGAVRGLRHHRRGTQDRFGNFVVKLKVVVYLFILEQ